MRDDGNWLPQVDAMRRNDAIKARQSGLHSNPKISVGGLGNRVGRSSKNSILYSPCRVPILKICLTGIECADWIYGKEKEDKAEQKKSRSNLLHCF